MAVVVVVVLIVVVMAMVALMVAPTTVQIQIRLPSVARIVIVSMVMTVMTMTTMVVVVVLKRSDEENEAQEGGGEYGSGISLVALGDGAEWAGPRGEKRSPVQTPPYTEAEAPRSNETGKPGSGCLCVGPRCHCASCPSIPSTESRTAE